MGTLEFIQSHFWHALPILVAGVFATAIILERVRAIFVHYPLKDSKGFFDRVTEFVLSGRTAEAVSLCDQHGKKPLANVVKAALVRAHLPDAMVEHGLQYALGESTQAIQKRTSFLATIANIATLLGLFGTILGLIQSFQAIGHADAQQKSALLANGIATAMNATMLGLGVAIPCMVAFSFITNRANRLIAELENNAVKTLEILKQRYYATDRVSPAQSPSQTGNGGGGKVIPFGRAA